VITVIRTATAFPGMTGDAVAWAKEIATIVERATGKEQVVCTAFAGLLSDIAWIGRYDSVGEYDDLRREISLFPVASVIRFGSTSDCIVENVVRCRTRTNLCLRSSRE
jgi:hypothetical protein